MEKKKGEWQVLGHFIKEDHSALQDSTVPLGTSYWKPASVSTPKWVCRRFSSSTHRRASRRWMADL